MDQAVAVRARQSAAQLLHQIQLRCQRYGLCPTNQLCQCVSGDILHGNERMPLVVARIEHRDDIGVLEAASGARLLHEARADIDVLDLVADELDREPASNHGVDRQIQTTHAALTEEPLDLVAPDLRGESVRIRHVDRGDDITGSSQRHLADYICRSPPRSGRVWEMTNHGLRGRLCIM